MLIKFINSASVQAGLAKHVGLSEFSAANVRRGVAPSYHAPWLPRPLVITPLSYHAL